MSGSDTPHTDEFIDAVRRERLFQRAKWASEHDTNKTHADWYWTLGFLAGKALSAALTGDRKKALHHTISTAALLSHWFDHIQKDLIRCPDCGRTPCAPPCRSFKQ